MVGKGVGGWWRAMKSEPTTTSSTFLTLSYFPPKLHFIHCTSYCLTFRKRLRSFRADRGLMRAVGGEDGGAWGKPGSLDGKKNSPLNRHWHKDFWEKKKKVLSGTAEPPGTETFSSGVPAGHWLLLSLKCWLTPIGTEQFCTEFTLPMTFSNVTLK